MAGGLVTPTAILEVGFTSDPFSTVSWTDISSRMRSMKTTGGRQHELNRVEAGTLEVLLENRNRDFDPTNTSSPYYNSGVGLVPMRPVRLRATWSGVTYAVWYGYVDSWAPQWPDETTSDVVLRASDGLKILALKNITSSAYSAQIVADGATGYWRLGDSPNASVAADSAGTHPGTYINNPTLGADGVLLADIDTAATFDKTKGQYVKIPAAMPTAGQHVSVEAWVKWAGASGDNGFVVSVGDFLNPLLAIDIMISGTSGNVQVDAGNGTATTSGATVTDGAWHHLAATVNASTGAVVAYIDGVSRGTATVTYSPPTGSNIWIGWDGAQFNTNGTQSIVTGTIDEVAVYYNVLLSGAQVLNHYNLGVGAFAVQSSGQRIGAVLNTIGVPAGYQSLAAGVSQVMAPTASLATTKAMTYVDTVTTTEEGLFYQDPTGVYTFKDRHYTISTAAANTSQATFADDSVGGHFHYLPPLRLQIDDLDLWNEVVVQRDGGVAQSADDTTSQGHYAKRTLSRTGQLQTGDNECADQAHFLLAKYKTPLPRVTDLVLGSEVDAGATLPQMLGRALWDRVTVTRGNMVPHNGVTFTQDSLIEGIEHSYDAAQGRWETIFHLSRADAATGWLILNDAVFGKLDSNHLAY